MSLIKLSLINLRRRPYQNLAVFLSLFIIYSLISLFVLVLMGSNRVLKYFASQPQITAFLKTEASEASINQLIMKIQQTNKVKMVRYINKKQAFKLYQQVSKNPILLDIVDESVFPASIEVSTYQPADLEAIYTILETSNIVEDIIYQRDLVQIINRWIKNIRLAGSLLVGFFLLQTVLVIWIVTGFKISNFRQSINIMRLLGASKNYISLIFVLESLMIGVLAGLFAFGLVFGLIIKAEPIIINLMGQILNWQAIPYNLLLLLLPILVMAGGLFNALLSFIASRRFLR